MYSPTIGKAADGTTLAAPAAGGEAGFNPVIKSSVAKQLYWLTRRELLNIRRDVTSMAARMGMYVWGKERPRGRGG